MSKLDRLLFDIGCIIMIIILPYFVLEKIGIVDYVARSKQKGVAIMKTNTGTEHGIKWEIEWNGENIRITVSTEDGSKTETRYYNCKYPVVCGYDVHDCNKVEELLDEMIVKYANDGYKGFEK